MVMGSSGGMCPGFFEALIYRHPGYEVVTSVTSRCREDCVR